MKRIVWDIETNGLLHGGRGSKPMDRVHLITMQDVTNGYDEPVLAFRRNDVMDNIAEGLAILSAADEIIGHNIIAFDIPALKRVYPDFDLKPGVKVYDTLVLTRMIVPDLKKSDAGLAKQGKLPGKLVGSHSLDAWGHRLGKHKGNYSQEMIDKGLDPWAVWNQDMEDYGILDVVVNTELWKAVEVDLPPDAAIVFETAAHDLTEVMKSNGVPFDAEGGLELGARLSSQLTTHIESVKAKYDFWFAPDKKYVVKDPWPKPENLSKKQKKSIAEAQKGKFKPPRTDWGEDYSRAIWADITFPKVRRNHADRVKKWEKECEAARKKGKPLPDRPKQLLPDCEPGSPFCKIKRVDFNPGSRDHIIDRFTTLHGWEPFDFTDTGRPSVNDEVLQKLKDVLPEAEPLAEIFFYKKLLGMMAEGDNSWIKHYNEETGCIHGRINTGGTVSGRCSHNSPNLGQVPGVEAEPVVRKDGSYDPRFVIDGVLVPWAMKEDGTPKKKAVLMGRTGEFGWECRSLFGVRARKDAADWMQVGVDLINIEGRCLAARMSEFDNGELIDALCYQGVDLHDFNMAKTGIKNRGIMKRVFFGLIYGAGDPKLGYTAQGGLTHAQADALGKEYRALIMTSIPALAKVTEKVQAEAVRNGCLIGVDGRRLGVRNDYAALNLRLQSDAGLIAKMWAVLSEQNLLKAGYSHGWLGHFAMMLFVHDELQTGARREYAHDIADIIVSSATEAGEVFKYPAPVAADPKLGMTWAECH